MPIQFRLISDASAAAPHLVRLLRPEAPVKLLHLALPVEDVRRRLIDVRLRRLRRVQLVVPRAGVLAMDRGAGNESGLQIRTVRAKLTDLPPSDFLRICDCLATTMHIGCNAEHTAPVITSRP